MQARVVLLNIHGLAAVALCAIFACALTARGEEPRPESPTDALFASADEAAAWRWLLERSGRAEHVERDGRGKLKWIGFYDAEKMRGAFYSGSLTLDDDRHVVQMTFDAAHFTDDDFQRIARFTHLRRLTAWHNGWAKDQTDKSVYSGAGLVHLRALPLEEVNFGGSWFNDEGLAAARQLPRLKVLHVYHTRVTDAGFKALRGHPTLAKLVVGPQFSERVTAAALADIATLPKLEEFEFNEVLLPWEKGLAHLVPLGKQLKRVKFDQAYIADEDLARLSATLPETRIEYTPAKPEHLRQMRRER